MQPVIIAQQESLGHCESAAVVATLQIAWSQ
jgi:hypothetical protein